MAESIDDVSGSPNSGLRAAAEFKGKIALLTNFLPPYRIKVLELLMGSVGALRIFVSVQM